MGGKTTDYMEESKEDADKFVGIKAPYRSVLVGMLQDGDRDVRYPVLSIGMPCGREYFFGDREEVPERTLMCGCGDPNHIVIQYSVEGSDGTGEKEG